MAFIIGTAGHIDHGKTALVRALTGQDTDRLPEEKARGISIDLGFAWFDLPGGTIMGGNLSTIRPITSFKDSYFRENVEESVAHAWYAGDWQKHPYDEPMPEPKYDDFNADAYLTGLEKLAAAGVTWVQVGLPGDSLTHVLETIDRFGSSVIKAAG